MWPVGYRCAMIILVSAPTLTYLLTHLVYESTAWRAVVSHAQPQPQRRQPYEVHDVSRPGHQAGIISAQVL